MKKKLIIGGLVLALIVGIISVGVMKSKNTGAFSNGKAVEVKLASAKLEDISATIPVSGIIQEVGKEEVYFDAGVKITTVYVEKDQTVKKGQKLVEFDMDSLNNQLTQAKLSLNIQMISLNKIKDALKLQSQAQAQSALDQAKNALAQAKSNFERIQKLYEQGSASFVEYENAKINYQNSQAQHSIAENNLNDITKNNSDLTSNNKKDIENQNEQIKLTQLTIKDLQDKISKLNNQSIAPIDGVITECNVEKGSVTSPAVKAFKIINPNQLEVVLEVKEVDALKVKEGQTVEITGDAFPGKTINGTVKSVGAVAIKKIGANSSDDAYIEVKVAVDNSDKFLKPGLSVSAKIVIETKKNTVVIPFDGFQEDKDSNKWVFVVENNVAKQKSIKIGITSNMNLEVVEGLKGNETIVQDPPSRLRDGMKIVAQSSDKK